MQLYIVLHLYLYICNLFCILSCFIACRAKVNKFATILALCMFVYINSKLFKTYYDMK